MEYDMVLEENAVNSLQQKFIDNLITTQSLVSVYLKNSIRLKGHIIGHDKPSIFLCAAKVTQMIRKDKVNAILPETVFETWSHKKI